MYYERILRENRQKQEREQQEIILQLLNEIEKLEKEVKELKETISELEAKVERGEMLFDKYFPALLF